MNRIFATLLAMTVSGAAWAGEFSKLEELATQSLRKNIVPIGDKKYLRAGPERFTHLWTRDFAFASRGLLVLKEYDLIRDQIEMYLQHMREDRLLPRRMEYKKGSDKLKPNYDGAMGIGMTIDSNILILLTAADYVQHTGDQAWWEKNQDTLVKVYRFYDDRLQDGLIVQADVSDWQDNVYRNGRAFYTNLLYFMFSQKVAADPAFAVTPEKIAQMRKVMYELFQEKESGLFYTLEKEIHISLDAHLLALDFGFFVGEEAQKLYQDLKKSEFWTRHDVPGFNTFPDYPSEKLPPLTKISGYSRYHDRMYWSWLMALAAKVAYKMGDKEESRRIFAALEKIAERDGGVSEIYLEEPPHPPFRNLFFRSEPHFSWGSGVVLNSLQVFAE